MAGDWIECKLADVCESVDYGYTAAASDTAIGPRFLRITDIVGGVIEWESVPHIETDTNTLQKFRLAEGDIVIARTGASTGASAYISEPPTAVFASYLVRLRVRPGVHPRYVAYYLKSSEFVEYVRGVLGDKSAQPNASASTLVQAPFRAPKSLATQRAIAHILGTLDDKIELNRRMNATLEGIARAIFKSWFVDFDPVRAKAEGRDPGLPKHLADSFPNRLVASELGEIPEGWSIRPVSSLADVRRDIVNPGEYPAEVFAHYSIPAYDAGVLPSIELGRDIKSNKFMVPKGCILISRLNPRIQRVWLTPNESAFQPICSTEFLVLLPAPTVTREYLFCLLAGDRFSAEFASLATGTSGSHQRVRPEGLMTLLTVLPPRLLVDAFTDVVRPFFQLSTHSLSQSQTLANVRDTLLPKLISGQLRVPDAERTVGEHT